MPRPYRHPARAQLDMDDLEEEMLQQYMGRNVDVRVKIEGARGLPPQVATGAYASFRWFVDEEPRHTEASAARTINPNFEYDETIRQVVTEDFCNWVSSDMLVFEVYGRYDQEMAHRPLTTKRARRGRPSSAAGEDLGDIRDEDNDDDDDDNDGGNDEVLELKAQLREAQRQREEEQERNRQRMKRLKETGGLTEDESVACSMQ